MPATRIWSEYLALHTLAGSMRRWCREHGQSQGVLAMRVGVSSSHINRIMHEQARPSAALAKRILAVIGSARSHAGVAAPPVRPPSDRRSGGSPRA